MRTENILIIGNYGAQNIGDEAILAGILQMLETRYSRKQITVLSYNPGDTIKRHQIHSEYLFPFGVRSLFRGTFLRSLKVLKKADIILIGGGGLFTDEKMKAMYLWGFHVWLAALYGKQVFLFANSVGPIRTNRGKRIMTRTLSRVRGITVRDQPSFDLIRSLNKTVPMRLTADPALLLNKLVVQRRKKRVLVSIRPWLYNESNVVNSLVVLINYLANTGYEILLVPFQTLRDDDRVILSKIRDNVLNKDCVQLVDNLDMDSILRLIVESEAVIGMRLHSLILATGQGTPFLALGYSQKVKGFVDTLDLADMYIDLADLTPELLLEKWNILEKNYAVIKNKLHKKMTNLTSLALKNMEIL